MKQIFKSIIANPGKTTGLIIEVMIVTIIGWIVIEPVAVKTSIALTPAGYDYERLVKVSLDLFSQSSEKYDSEVTYDKEHQDSAYDHLLLMLRQRDGVENATFDYSMGFESASSGMSSLRADSFYNKDGEDNYVGITMIDYKPGTDYFTTFGIKDINGKPFSEPVNDGSSYIISKTAAKSLYHDVSAIGMNLFNWDDEDKSGIIGIVEDTPYKKGDGRNAIAFRAANEEWSSPDGIVLRLREGVNPRAFVDRLIADMPDYRSGNFYITHPQLFSDMRDEMFSGQKRELTQKWIIVIFFLVNMFLGIAGTFYVQCKTRIPDAGVMRAFGARRSLIEWSIIGEACMLAFIGWILGSIIYLIYLKFQGFPMEFDTDSRIIRSIRPLWFDTKLGRYSVIGGIILLLLLVTSTLGAWLPARKVGRVPIVDSLRDE
ncbi:MAG: hypothetical protein K2K45_08060 [Muribaculaceae bacterium]|nr:hypothetical protein [Muribaculaceae bacterium]